MISTRWPALSSTTLRAYPAVLNRLLPVFGKGMYFIVPSAGCEIADCGITPPGNTQLAVLAQPAGPYGSPEVTV